jgi:hypothetical protein
MIPYFFQEGTGFKPDDSLSRKRTPGISNVYMSREGLDYHKHYDSTIHNTNTKSSGGGDDGTTKRIDRILDLLMSVQDDPILPKSAEPILPSQLREERQ